MKYRKSDWRTRSCLTAGQKGTLKESNKYGDDLVAVRYRYDVNSGRRIKTVEIVVEEKDVAPKVEGVGFRPKRYPCRDFTPHYKAIHTCSNCGWPRQDHKKEKAKP